MHTHTFAPVVPRLAAVLGTAILACAVAAPAALAAEKQTVSASLAKPLHEAQESLKAGKYQDALTKLRQADAASGKSAYDQYVIAQLEGFAYIKTQNYGEAAKAMETELNSGFTPPAEVPQKVRALAQINYQLKNYDKAIEYATRAVKGGFANGEMPTLLAQAYYLKGDWKGTLRAAEGGNTPEMAQLALSACIKLQDAACQTKQLERLVTLSPKPEYWSSLLFSMQKDNSGNDTNLLETFRLMSDVDILKTPEDFNEMAQLALDAGSPGEAQRTLEKGFAKNVFTDKRAQDRNQRLLDSAKKSAASDQATLPKVQREADAATTGAKNVGVGVAYFGYGQYDKAVDELNKGISKGGLRNEADARLILGIAQLKAGHKDDALKTFKSVKGDAALERLASLWALHARQA